MSIGDLEGSIQVTIPAQIFQRHYQILQNYGPFIIEGTIEGDPQHNRYYLVAEKVFLLS
jgi:hypothetical protein